MRIILSLTGCTAHNETPTEPVPKHIHSIPSSTKRYCVAKRKAVVVAVIDTGFGASEDWTGQYNAHLCKFGHKDFTGGLVSTNRFNTKDAVPVDNHGHGTHIAGLIDSYASRTNDNFCLVVLKYYDPSAGESQNLARTVEAINYARQIHADIINYSGGGVQASAEETAAVKAFLDAGGTFVAAAGNEGLNAEFFHFYPAQDDDRVIAVGNGKDEKHRAKTSNYGRTVKRWENGTNVLVYAHYMTGTSQSAAIVTGKIVAEKNKSCK